MAATTSLKRLAVGFDGLHSSGRQGRPGRYGRRAPHAPDDPNGVMNCPSCSSKNDSSASYCVRCGFSLSSRTLWIGPTRSTLTWALRRSLAGMSAGFVGWLILPAAGRAVGEALSQTGHLMLTGVIGGIFLGAVEGMLEESTLKTLRGGLAGILGGLIGGVLSSLISGGPQADPSRGILVVMTAWAMVGLCIGLMNAWLEPQTSRKVAGAVSGFIGGALGGWLAYQMYASLSDILVSQSWLLKRLIEAITGGILGAVLWFIMGLAEKHLILKRRVIKDANHKECDNCKQSNPLQSWYCGACGMVLQVAASPDKLQLPKKEALARLTGALRYAARLCATTSIVLAGLALYILSGINIFLGLFGMLAAALLGHILYISFTAISEWLTPS